jgi:hypothetical protein
MPFLFILPIWVLALGGAGFLALWRPLRPVAMVVGLVSTMATLAAIALPVFVFLALAALKALIPAFPLWLTALGVLAGLLVIPLGYIAGGVWGLRIGLRRFWPKKPSVAVF